MNETFKRRLIGLAVLIGLLLLLSFLLPGSNPRERDTVPVIDVALDGHPTAEPTAPRAVQSDAGGDPPVLRPPVAVAPAERPAPVAGPDPKPPPAAAAAPASAPLVSATGKLPQATPSPRVAPDIPAPKSAKVDKPVSPSASAPAPAAVASAKPAAPVAGPWFVQIGSFADAGNADTTVSLLHNIGYRAEATRIAGTGGKTLHRVRLGPFATEAAAREAQQRVAGQGYPQAKVRAN